VSCLVPDLVSGWLGLSATSHAEVHKLQPHSTLKSRLVPVRLGALLLNLACRHPHTPHADASDTILCQWLMMQAGVKARGMEHCRIDGSIGKLPWDLQGGRKLVG